MALKRISSPPIINYGKDKSQCMAMYTQMLNSLESLQSMLFIIIKHTRTMINIQSYISCDMQDQLIV